MPLKVLHGILAEPGTVAVVGLSNWRLDPAKMNRSVCLARPDPDSAEVGRTGLAGGYVCENGRCPYYSWAMGPSPAKTFRFRGTQT